MLMKLHPRKAAVPMLVAARDALLAAEAIAAAEAAAAAAAAAAVPEPAPAAAAERPS